MSQQPDFTTRPARRRWLDAACIAGLALALLVVLIFADRQDWSLSPVSADAYGDKLFAPGRVHTLDIRHGDWQGFLDAAAQEVYSECDIVIDGETLSHVGLRAKGNNSLRLTEKYGSDRFSLKVEVDHFVDQTYYGLDKFCLDASFQDNAYLKTALTLDMMASVGVPTPLWSWVWVTVNGEDWGLFLAVEEPEEAFARRVYGREHGQLYKPDYKSLNDENADVALRYTDEAFESYDNIFRNAKFDVSSADKRRLISALRILDSGVELERAIDVEEVLSYFTVQVFVVNVDSYLGHTGHNYFLYEKNGVLQILPWDYNLAYGTYLLGMPDPVNDATATVNRPINTPAEGEVMRNRPLYHKLMMNRDHYDRYHEKFDAFLRDYFESGYCDRFLTENLALIDPYVRRDPTAFISYEDFLTGAQAFRLFCSLRAQSVRGQLDGTIPSTIRAQAEDSSSFVDASALWLPDLGEVADLRE